MCTVCVPIAARVLRSPACVWIQPALSTRLPTLRRLHVCLTTTPSFSAFALRRSRRSVLRPCRMRKRRIRCLSLRRCGSGPMPTHNSSCAAVPVLRGCLPTCLVALLGVVLDCSSSFAVCISPSVSGWLPFAGRALARSRSFGPIGYRSSGHGRFALRRICFCH